MNNSISFDDIVCVLYKCYTKYDWTLAKHKRTGRLVCAKSWLKLNAYHDYTGCHVKHTAYSVDIATRISTEDFTAMLWIFKACKPDAMMKAIDTNPIIITVDALSIYYQCVHRIGRHLRAAGCRVNTNIIRYVKAHLQTQLNITIQA